MKLIAVDDAAIYWAVQAPSPWSPENPAPRYIAQLETTAMELRDQQMPVRWWADRWGYSIMTAHRTMAKARKMQEAYQ